MDDVSFNDIDVPNDLAAPSDTSPDIWENSTSPDAVLPPLDVDIMEDFSRVIGNPEELSEHWKFQEGPNDCALYAQGGILEAEGQTFDLEKFRDQGVEGGWYSPEAGTYLDHMGDLLEENGVSITCYNSASIQDMAGELEQGHGVVAAVDCLPIWGEPGGHALWVTGIDVGSDGVPVSVTCNDLGRQDGEALSYPFEDFKDAWASFGNTMVATTNSINL